MDIYSKVGTKVIFAYPDSGYPYHQKITEHLELGGVYTVERIDVGDFHTNVFFNEVPGVAFNSVLFEHSAQTTHRTDDGDEAGATFTMDMLEEAQQLIKALAPNEAPADAIMVRGTTGLRIIKNDLLPENTVMVSKRLFDMIYESSTQRHKE